MWRADGHESCFDAYRRAAFFPRDGDVSQERYDARRLYLSGFTGQGRSAAEIRSQVVYGRLCEDGAGIRMRRTGWHRVAAMAKTHMGSGWGTPEAYETLGGNMTAEIRSDKPFDGIYLCLHGAMAVRGVPRPEAE